MYALAVLMLCAAAVLGYLAGAQSRRNESHYMLMQALDDVRRAETDVRRVGAVVEAGLPADGGRAAAEAEPSRKEALSRTRSALDLVYKSQSEIKDEDRPLAAAVRQSTLGRVEMMKAAADLLRLQARAGGALRSADLAWRYFTEAAELSDRAAARFNTHTRAGVSESTTLTASAESALASASAELTKASQLMPEAALAPVAKYVEDRRGLARESRRIDAVWLSGRVDEANRMLAKLTVREVALDARIRDLPETPAVPVTAAYAKLGKKGTADYAAALLIAEGGDTRLGMLATAQPSE